MNDDREDRRANAIDIHSLAECYHALNTRVAVLETRLDEQDHRLLAIETDVRAAKQMIDRVFEKLVAHAEREAEIQKRILAWTIATLVGVLCAISTTVGKYFLLSV